MRLFKIIVSIFIIIFIIAFCLGNLQDIDLLPFDSDIIVDQQNSTQAEIYFTEVHSKDDLILAEYVIIESKYDYNGLIEVKGLGNGQYKKSFDLNIKGGERAIVSDNIDYFSKSVNSVFVEAISLTDSGEELQILDGSGVLLDSVKFVSSKNNQSLFFNGNYDGNHRLFDSLNTPSVELDKSLFSSENIVLSGTLASVKLINPLELKSPFFSTRTIDNVSFSGGLSLDLPVLSGSLSFQLLHNNQLILERNLDFSFNDDTNIFDDFTGNIVSGSGTLDVYTGIVDYSSGNFQTGSNDGLEPSTGSGDAQELNLSGNLNNTITGPIQISEINPQDGKYPEYIEIISNSVYSGNITILGLGNGDSSKTIFLDVPPLQRIIITDSQISDIINIQQIVIPSISLTNDGESLVILGQDGQVMDSVVYSMSSVDKSLYYSFSDNGVRYFQTVLDNTPSFDDNLIIYFKSLLDNNTTYSCGTKLQNSNGFYVSSSINLIGLLNGKELSNSSNYACEWTIGDIQFNQCNPSYYKHDIPGVYNGILNISSNGELICSSNFSINVPVQPVSYSCSEDYYKELYINWKNKYYEKSPEIQNIQNDLTETQNSNSNLYTGFVTIGNISIESILPNPDGTDKDKEEITFINSSDSFTFSKDYILKYGKRNQNLSGFTLNRGKTTFTGDFQFYNSQSCIELFSGNMVLDKYCYPDAKSGKIYSRQDQVEILSLPSLNIKMKLYDDKSCVIIDSIESKCIDLKYTKSLYNELKDSLKVVKSDLKKLNTDYKKLEKLNNKNIAIITKNEVSFTKKINKIQDKYDKLKLSSEKRIVSLKKQISQIKISNKELRERYSKRKKSSDEKLKQLKQSNKERLAKEKKKVTSLQVLSSYEKNYHKSIMSNLKQNWYSVYKESQLDNYENLYKKYKKQIDLGVDEKNYLTMKIKIRDFEKLLNIELGKIGLMDIYTYHKKNLTSAPLAKNINKILNQLKKNK